ncbi:hypothetical protein [Deinococcus alpinitundrae]|uniref:hypothetical protein n=1 Tax=Deinococcus alpinitundrae TaxID=468913 RepID=UPI00137B269F|nr:hypothetical protein [Deinococcus alpinitundrae]
MPIKMQPSAGRSSDDTNRFEGDPGTYVFTLQEIVIDQGSEYEDKSQKYPQARFVWADADGDTFSDSFIRIPLGFKLNDKAKWTNRLSALVGRPLTDEDAHRLSIDIRDGIENYDDLDDAVTDVLDNGRPAFFKVKALTFDGESLFGRQAQLTLGVNPKGYNTCAAAGASPLPSAGGKKKKAAAVEAESGQLLDPPPAQRRNATTEPEFGY